METRLLDLVRLLITYPVGRQCNIMTIIVMFTMIYIKYLYVKVAMFILRTSCKIQISQPTTAYQLNGLQVL